MPSYLVRSDIPPSRRPVCRAVGCTAEPAVPHERGETGDWCEEHLAAVREMRAHITTHHPARRSL